MEVKYMWGAKLRLSTILYIFCRHAMLGNVLYLLAISQFFGAGDRVCLPSETIVVTDVWCLVHQISST
jgi:hypothetical protein